MIFQKKKPLSPLEEAVYTVQKKLNQWDKQRKHWKRRLYITIVFPVVLMLILIKAIKTYVRIKLWEIGTKAPSPFQNEDKSSKGDKAIPNQTASAEDEET